MPINRLRYTETSLLDIRAGTQLYGANRTVGKNFYDMPCFQSKKDFYGLRYVKFLRLALSQGGTVKLPLYSARALKAALVHKCR